MFKKISETLQIIGRSMLLPIAAMPAAALLNRFGDVDMLNMMYVKEAGWVIFKYLPLLFAIGIAGGIAKDKDVASGLAAFIGYEITVNLIQPFGGTNLNTFGLPAIEDAGSNILFGIIVGIVTGFIYNRFSETELPSAFAFFSGKRLVLIINSFVSIAVAGCLNFIFPVLDTATDRFGEFIGSVGVWGPFLFGFFNRLLIPTGLHHILNTYIQMQLPSPDAAFALLHPNVVGEIPRYFMGDPTAGTFVAGFFPVMMFGLPGAALAMIFAAKKENRKKVVGLLGGAALASFLTGITEPVEFSFMFVAFPLYLVHCFYMGMTNILANLLHAKNVGVGGSGIIDFVLQYNRATNPLWLIAIGIADFWLYFITFYFAIKKFNFQTPGREEGSAALGKMTIEEKAVLITKYLGGMDNIKELDNCISRLRLQLVNPEKVDVDKLKAMGIIEVIRLTNNRMQVIVGLEVELIAKKMKGLVK